MTIHELKFSSAPEIASENAECEYSDIDDMIWTLLAGVFAPPLLALVNVYVNHLLGPLACASGRPAILHLVSFFILALVVLSGAGAARCLARIWTARAIVSRPGFMGIAGVFTSAAFSTIIIADWLPSRLLLACQ